MTILELKSKFLIELDQIYPKEEILSFFFLLVHHKLRFSRTDIALNINQLILKEDLNYFLDALVGLRDEKPIQYIIGETEFYSLRLKVNQNVLIPRPETEELVDWILKEFNKKQHLNILDMGTGSGCIAIALAKNLPLANVYAIDISEDALTIAQHNAKQNNVKVNFIQQDILKMGSTASSSISLCKDLLETSFPLEFDIIVSNPPYVRELEKHEIQRNVLQNEPHISLFVSNKDPLLFYDKITDVAKQYLKPNGLLFLEINQYLGKETTLLIQQKGFKTIELRKDIFGNDRMIKTSLA